MDRVFKEVGVADVGGVLGEYIAIPLHQALDVGGGVLHQESEIGLGVGALTSIRSSFLHLPPLIGSPSMCTLLVKV